MRLTDVINEPEIQALQPQFEAKGVDFESAVIEGIKQSEELKRFNAATGFGTENPSKVQIINFIVNYLLELLRENVKPKRKGWRIFWDVLFLGAPILLRKLQKK